MSKHSRAIRCKSVTSEQSRSPMARTAEVCRQNVFRASLCKGQYLFTFHSIQRYNSHHEDLYGAASRVGKKLQSL